ncbi:MAG: TfoX/Sxy family protein [Pseudomonadota bacterium]
MLSQEEIDDLFAAFGKVRRRPMFGGAGLYADGLMFAIDTEEGVFLKADTSLSKALEARGSRPFTYPSRGKTIRLGFWSLPENSLDNPEELAELAQNALAVARAAAEAKVAPRTSSGNRGGAPAPNRPRRRKVP